MNDLVFHLHRLFRRGVLLGCVAFCSAPASIRMLIIDTQGKDAYYYHNLIELAQTAGFSVSYRSLYDFLENPAIDEYDALLYMLTPGLIAHTATRSIFCSIPLFQDGCNIIYEHCIIPLLNYAQLHHKAIGIFLPSGIPPSSDLFNQTQNLLNILTHASSLDPATTHFIDSFLRYSTTPDNKKGIIFGTALLNKTVEVPSFPAITDQEGTPQQHIINPETQQISTQLVPIDQQRYNDLVQKALPNGLLVHNPHVDGIYLISKTSEFTASDIAENFLKTPRTIKERNALLKAQLETLQEWYQACVRHTLSEKTPQPVALPARLSEQWIAQAQQRKKRNDLSRLAPAYRQLLQQGISCAWLDPYDFFAHEDTHGALKKMILSKQPDLTPDALKQEVEDLALKRGIHMIYEGGFNLLWFEFIPEWYLSSHGLRADQRAEYIKRIRRLGSALTLFFKQKRLPLPKIFVGLNLTSNFRTYPVQNPVRTIFGATHTKIPSPFDYEHFWEPEVIDVFASFVKECKNHLPIDGIFFDFEMYHAQDQGGSITDLMDFSECAWHTYCAYTPHSPSKSKRFKQRIAYLQRHKKFKNYFMVLQKAMEDIGRRLKRELQAQIPGLLFGAYAPTLPYSWCYRGLMAGLSSPSEPLLLATFNTDAISHDIWLKTQNIYLLHGTAVMLSQLQPPDFSSIIESILVQHDFAWFNRPSRLIYPYTQKKLDKCWWGIESNATPYPLLFKNFPKKR